MSDTPLNIPGGSYLPTQTCFITDAIGQQWATSMSDARLRPKVFGVHVWYRKSATSPWQFLFVMEGRHGWLTVDRGRLQFIYNTPSTRSGLGGSFRRIVSGYVHTRPKVTNE
jgi:hypothetical protein